MDSAQHWRIRLTALMLGLLGFLTVAARLYRLMVVDYDYYAAKALNNQTRSTAAASNRGYDTFTIIFYSILAISLVLLPLTDWGSFRAFLAEAPVGNTVFTLAHAAFTTILPYALYTLSQLYLDGGMVAILASGGEPTAACLFGALFFQEYPSVWNLLGLAVTVAALTLLCRPERKR